MEREQIFTDRPTKSLWDRLSTLTIKDLIVRLICNNLDPEKYRAKKHLVEEKAEGIAYCVDNALDYFAVMDQEINLTVSLLSYYYGTFSFFMALLLKNMAKDYTLKRIEKICEYGHGLANIESSSEEFPDNQKLYFLCGGFLSEYLDAYGTNIKKFCFQRRHHSYEKINPEEQGKLISFSEVISRIPELESVYLEVFGKRPEYFAYKKYSTYKQGVIIEVPTPVNPKLTTDDIKRVLPYSTEIVKEGSVFRVIVENEEALKKNTYHSPIIRPHIYYIKPLREGLTNDILLIHFMCLYELSIIVRYKPVLWNDILQERYETYYPLIRNYLSIAGRVIANIFLNYMYDREFEFIIT